MSQGSYSLGSFHIWLLLLLCLLCRSRPMFIASQWCSHNGLFSLTLQVPMVMLQVVTVPSSVSLNSAHVFISSHYIDPSSNDPDYMCHLFPAKTLTIGFSLPICLPLAISASWAPADTWRNKVSINSSVRMYVSKKQCWLKSYRLGTTFWLCSVTKKKLYPFSENRDDGTHIAVYHGDYAFCKC